MKSTRKPDHGSNPGGYGKTVLRLFIAGANRTYCRAITCIKTFCEEELDADYELDVVVIICRPEVAEAMSILATPTLIRVSPEPAQRICGDLPDRKRLVAELFQRRPR